MITPFALGFLTAILIIGLVAPYGYIKWKKQKAELLEEYARFVDLTEATKDFLYYYQIVPEKKYLYLSPSADIFFGEGAIEYAYQNPQVCYTDVHPDDYESLCKKIDGEIDYSKSIIQRWKDQNGVYRCFEEYAIPIYENGKLVALKGILRNIDEKIEMQQELEYRIHHDGLTDLYNREYFEKKYAELDEQLDISVAIIICDLDELKYVNDNFGHREGDKLIKETARVLNKFSSDIVTVVRLGGDEFAMIIAHATEKETEALIESINNILELFHENSLERKIKLSMGSAFTNNSKGNMTELFLQADKRMYENKTKRKQSVVTLS
ncbi:diguanylate cyclase domain-containing protein [Psychrobacillus sp. NPDC093180]|uniref:sensor domain-containing diguanylate cyclase n=1 Tax=Psychrobacillus sp. NPDC093180 TaxID=3364489 RepID=UPI003813FAA9